MATLYPHKILLLRTGFQSPGRPLLYGRASLYFDRLELSGWRLNRRYRETIPIDDVDRAEWDAGDEHLVRLHFETGDARVLRVSRPKRWQRALELRLSWTLQDRRPAGLDRMPATLSELAMVASSFS